MSKRNKDKHFRKEAKTRDAESTSPLSLINRALGQFGGAKGGGKNSYEVNVKLPTTLEMDDGSMIYGQSPAMQSIGSVAAMNLVDRLTLQQMEQAINPPVINADYGQLEADLYRRLTTDREMTATEIISRCAQREAEAEAEDARWYEEFKRHAEVKQRTREFRGPHEGIIYETVLTCENHHFAFQHSGRLSPENLQSVLKAKRSLVIDAAWQSPEVRLTFKRGHRYPGRLDFLEYQQQRAMEFYAMNGLLGGLTGPAKRPETEEHLAPVIYAPTSFKSGCGRFTAEILDTNFKTWDESDKMRNCCYRVYTPLIKKRSHLVYHIHAPHIFDNGFSVVLEKTNSKKEARPDIHAVEYRDVWEIEQIRGKANSKCDDRELQTFCDQLVYAVVRASERTEYRETLNRW